jgi:hypothetical protein
MQRAQTDYEQISGEQPEKADVNDKGTNLSLLKQRYVREGTYRTISTTASAVY